MIPTLWRLAILPILLTSGCAAEIGARGLAGQVPGKLSQIEAIKTELVMAPIAGCVSMLQQVNGQIRGLETGAPGIQVAPAIASQPTPSFSAPATAVSPPRPSRPTLRQKTLIRESPSMSASSSLQTEWEASGRPFTDPYHVVVARE